MDLDLVTGTLNIRDSEEPAPLGVPTTLDATVDDATGLIADGTFTAAPLEFEFDITDPVTATVYVDAEFTQITPGAATGVVTKLSETTAAVSVNVDVRVDLHIEVGNPSFLTANCTATPVSLRLTSTVLYDYETNQVSLQDSDFRVPPVPVTVGTDEIPGCAGIVADGVNTRLAGGGHSIEMNMEGEIPPLRIGIHPTATILGVEPGGSRQGDEVMLSATVVPGPDAPADPLAGVVEFRDGDTVLASVPVDENGAATTATTSLPVGHRPLVAVYLGDEVYAPSTSSVVAHLVAAAPTVTLPEVIQPIVIGGNARPVTVALANPADAGAAIAGARLDVTIARVGSLTSVFTPDRLTLEWHDGANWVPVTLTEVSPRVLQGTITGLALDAPDDLDVKLRLKAPGGIGTPNLAECTELEPTCPGPLTLTATLATGDGGRTFATDEGPVSLIETSRRPTTMVLPGGVLRPHSLRQGFSLLVAVSLRENFGSVPWSGLAEVYVDGIRVPMRDNSLPFEAGYADPYVVRSGTISGMILMPTDIDPGNHSLTVRYLGDPYHGPGEITTKFEIYASVGHPFVCREQTLSSQIEWGANFVFEDDLPASALPGAEIGFSVADARLLMHRPSISGLLIFASNNQTTPIGTKGLEGLSFDLNGQGTAAATALARAGGTSLPPSPNPAPVTAVDQTYTFQSVTGTTAVSGAAGDVVPVELTEVVVSYRDSVFGFPLTATCTARDVPMKIADVEIAGTELSVEPTADVVEGDEVTLTANTYPADATGTVTFTSPIDGELGTATVTDGVATLVTDDLTDGEHQITATFEPSDESPGSTSGAERLLVVPVPGSATEAFVTAALVDYTGTASAEDIADDAEDIDSGKTKASYLTELSRSDAYLTHVVNQMYLDTLGREGDADGVAFWVGRLRGGWSVARVTASFYGSAEYFVRAGGTAETWIDDLYGRLLGRSSDTGGRAFWVGEVDRAGRGAVALRFFQSRESARARVVALYELFLGRVPPLADQDFWATRAISQGDLALAVSLTVSAEYAERAEIRFPLV